MSEVQHKQPSNNEGSFEVHEKGDKIAALYYVLREEDVAVFRSTQVDPEHGGQGLGTKVLEAGVQWAKENGVAIVPQCSFVAHYFEKHPDQQELIWKG